MKLTALGKRKVDEIINEVVEKVNSGDHNIDIDYRSILVQAISRLFENANLPDIRPLTRFKEVDGVTSDHFNNLQDFMFATLRDYQQYIHEIGVDLNKLLDELLNSNIDISKKKKIVNAKIMDIENAVINKNNAKSIHDEILITSDFKDDNNVSDNTTNEITENGAITLPIVTDSAVTIPDVEYKIEFPIAAASPLGIESDVNNIDDYKLFTPGYYPGKLLGLLDQQDDIRLGSKITQILNTKIDRSWEVEYVTPNITTDRLRASMLINFANPVSLNALFIISNNQIDAEYLDEGSKEFIHIPDYNNEWFSRIFTRQIKLTIYGTNPVRMAYNLLSIIKNNVTVHTYNYIETLYRKRRDLYLEHLREYDIQHNNKVEGSVDVGEEKIVQKHKFRSSISMNSLTASDRTYAIEGVFETNETRVGNSIKAIEITSNDFVPNDTETEYIKFEASFDGKEFFPMRPTNKTINQYNNQYFTRIVLGESGSAVGYKYLEDKVYDTIYLRITLKTTNNKLSPVLYGYKVRVKTRD